VTRSCGGNAAIRLHVRTRGRTVPELRGDLGTRGDDD
jgi:hypothetical protein